MLRRIEYHSATSVPSAAKPTSLVNVRAISRVVAPVRSSAKAASACLKERNDGSRGEQITRASSDRVAGLRGERDRVRHERDVERHDVARRHPIAAARSEE